ncbi:lipopolysaccharide heptosyltransferase II [Paraphotobacterium marinum]|uniref:lipopolysaccharide heptosyltransferase II n=1 Tax=Paraphotobacterium marinum TaxID=1755811 RepID=A0A220VDM0_9GAMM|nr:lipopolysaccharide heptosyltransferase II [Paraphotobacterium marinum]ASK78053.1 lipopolysaccharide heptosyltransferase II [Paraphotobacterium marinum]
MMKSILIIAPAWLGDLVMSHALLKKLKREQTVQLDLAVPNWLVPVAKRIPEIRNIISIPFKHKELKVYKRYLFSKSLRTYHYDQVIVIPKTFKSALLAYWSHVPLRTGWVGEQRYFLLNDLRKNMKKVHLNVNRYLQLGEKKNSALLNDPIPEKYYPKLMVNKKNLNHLVKKFNIPLETDVIAICPGASGGEAKKWPKKYFSELIKDLIKKDFKILILGAPSDQARCDEIYNSINESQKDSVINLCGSTSLEDLIDILSLCKTAVSNDSGNLFVAAAVGINVVAIYGPTTPDYTPPLTKKAKILHTDISCRPCHEKVCPLKHHKCMEELFPKMVSQAVLNFNS